MLDFLDPLIDWLGDYNEAFDDFNQNISNVAERVLDASSAVTSGVTAENALGMFGLELPNIRHLKPKIQKVREKAIAFDLMNHATCMVLAGGAEFYLDRKKHFSFVKFALYYAAIYGFNSAVIHHVVILHSLKLTEEAIETFV